MNSDRFLSTWLPALAWMLLIFIASTDLMSAEHTSRFIAPFLRWLQPGITASRIAAVQLAVRKTAHVTEYAVLATLLARALGNSLRTWQWRDGLVVVCIAGCYAAIDEFHQSFVVSRTASFGDVMIDTLGAVVGVSCYHMLVSRRRRRAVASPGN